MSVCLMSQKEIEVCGWKYLITVKPVSLGTGLTGHREVTLQYGTGNSNI